MPEQVGAKVKEAVMTGGEALIEQGWKEGWKEGRDEGARRVFLTWLRVRFGEVSAAVARRVESASFEELERLAQSGYSARSAEELLGL